MKILIVDDLKNNRDVLQAMLEYLGHIVEIAVNGLDGINKWRECKPAVLFMDYKMPVMDGVQATHHIREEERNKNLNHTYIIGCSGFVSQADPSYEWDGFLEKPLNLDNISRSLSNVR